MGMLPDSSFMLCGCLLSTLRASTSQGILSTLHLGLMCLLFHNTGLVGVATVLLSGGAVLLLWILALLSLDQMLARHDGCARARMLPMTPLPV